MGTKRFGAASRYLPVDELLELPRVRVLRVLRHFDWLGSSDMLLALNEPNYDAVWRALVAHIKDGNIERRGSGPHEYRITQRGRAELAKLMARGDVNEVRVRTVSP